MLLHRICIEYRHLIHCVYISIIMMRTRIDQLVAPDTRVLLLRANLWSPSSFNLTGNPYTIQLLSNTTQCTTLTKSWYFSCSLTSDSWIPAGRLHCSADPSWWYGWAKQSGRSYRGSAPPSWNRRGSGAGTPPTTRRNHRTEVVPSVATGPGACTESKPVGQLLLLALLERVMDLTVIEYSAVRS